jgi:hypothetical protein
MVPDLRRAYVLWDVLPGQEERTERELVRRHAFRMGSVLARAPHVAQRGAVAL